MGLLIGLTIAAIVGYFISVDAKARGMNGLAWGLATFAIMIIALPLYLIVRKPRIESD